MNFEDMTQEQKDAAILSYINACNQVSFQNGGMALPKFNSLEEMKEFYRIVKECFPAANNKEE